MLLNQVRTRYAQPLTHTLPDQPEGRRGGRGGITLLLRSAVASIEAKSCPGKPVPHHRLRKEKPQGKSSSMAAWMAESTFCPLSLFMTFLPFPWSLSLR